MNEYTDNPENDPADVAYKITPTLWDEKIHKFCYSQMVINDLKYLLNEAYDIVFECPSEIITWCHEQLEVHYRKVIDEERDKCIKIGKEFKEPDDIKEAYNLYTNVPDDTPVILENIKVIINKYSESYNSLVPVRQWIKGIIDGQYYCKMGELEWILTQVQVGMEILKHYLCRKDPDYIHAGDLFMKMFRTLIVEGIKHEIASNIKEEDFKDDDFLDDLEFGEDDVISMEILDVTNRKERKENKDEN